MAGSKRGRAGLSAAVSVAPTRSMQPGAIALAADYGCSLEVFRALVDGGAWIPESLGNPLHKGLNSWDVFETRHRASGRSAPPGVRDFVEACWLARQIEAQTPTPILAGSARARL